MAVRGGTGTLGSQLNIIHRVLEGFWGPYRLTRARPTNGQYLGAHGDALRAAGFTSKEAYKLVDSARRYLTSLGLSVDDVVPRVPGAFPAPFLPGGPIP